jgi:hypothetical protein
LNTKLLVSLVSVSSFLYQLFILCFLFLYHYSQIIVLSLQTFNIFLFSLQLIGQTLLHFFEILIVQPKDEFI